MSDTLRQDGRSRSGRFAFGLAIVIGLPSLLYPYGGDAAMFEYVGRSWLEGDWPYVGAVDHKPPPIYFLHAMIVSFGGAHSSVIRVLEMVAVLWTGASIGRLLAAEDERVSVISPGMSALLMSAGYYAAFDYWDSAQVEIWVALFLVASWRCLATGGALSDARFLGAGSLAGIAFSIKFPAILPAAGIALIYAWRGGQSESSGRLASAFRSTTIFVAGAVGSIVLTFAPFAASDRRDALVEVLFRFNQFYSGIVQQHLQAVNFPLEVLGIYTMAAVLVVGLACVRAARGRSISGIGVGGVAVALLALAVLSVLVQGKIYPYHWGVVLPFMVAAIVWGGAKAVGRSFAFLRAAVFALAVLVVVVPPFEPASLCDTPGCADARSVLEYASGHIDRRSFLNRFDRFYRLGEVERLGEMIARFERPGDTLCVLDVFAPSFYRSSGLRCPSRFFTSLHLRVLEGRPDAGRFAGWPVEHRRSLRDRPPTFIVTLAQLEGATSFRFGRRYRPLGFADGFVLMVDASLDRS